MFPGALRIASTYAPLGTEMLYSLLSLRALFPAPASWDGVKLPSSRLHFSLTWEILPTICESSHRLPGWFLIHVTDKKIAELIP